MEVRSQSKSFVLEMRSAAATADWVKAVTDASNALAKVLGVTEASEKVAPVWVPDTPQCVLCNEEFGRITRRRHHCRSCGQCVCDDCSGQKYLLEHISKKPVRVCDICHKKLIKGECEQDMHHLSRHLSRRHSDFMFKHDSDVEGDGEDVHDSAYPEYHDTNEFQDDPLWTLVSADTLSTRTVKAPPPIKPRRRSSYLDSDVSRDRLSSVESSKEYKSSNNHEKKSKKKSTKTKKTKKNKKTKRSVPNSVIFGIDSDSSSLSQVRSFVERITAMYQHYNPDKLEDSTFVPTLCRHYKGHEMALVSQLVSKYGAEPNFHGTDCDISIRSDRESAKAPKAPKPPRRSSGSSENRFPSTSKSQRMKQQKHIKSSSDPPPRPPRNSKICEDMKDISIEKKSTTNFKSKSNGRKTTSPKHKKGASKYTKQKSLSQSTSIVPGSDRNWKLGCTVEAIGGSKIGKLGKLISWNNLKKKWLVDWGPSNGGERNYKSDNLQLVSARSRSRSRSSRSYSGNSIA